MLAEKLRAIGMPLGAAIDTLRATFRTGARRREEQANRLPAGHHHLAMREDVPS